MVVDGWSDPDEAPDWDLEAVCPGGPGGVAFRDRSAALAADELALVRRAEAAGTLRDDGATWSDLLREADEVTLRRWELCTFAVCAAAADTRSVAARHAEAVADDHRLNARRLATLAEAALDAATDEDFEAFVARPELVAFGPELRHARQGRRLRLAPALESLRVEMDREAILGWGRLYDLVTGDLAGQLDGPDGSRRVSISELAAMRAEPDAAVRHAAFRASQSAWRSVRDVCAHTLTQITGRRQAHTDRLGVDELATSLHDNRLRRETLDAMWTAADAARPHLVRYLRHKATLLGADGLAWADLDAPVAADERKWAWGDATRAIGEAFGAFHPELAAFTREALDGGWIDARVRDGRRQGGFCADLPVLDQSRIFLTFTGSVDNATTLAHELGHAWHNRVLAGQPACRTHLTSALAETASTFGEAIFRDQLLARAPDAAVRRSVLDQQLSAAVAFLMDIPHRFAIERRLYALRREGPLEPDRLDAVTVEAQQEAFGGALSSWNPTFWSSKLHFYIAEFGFYNWPYAFGYLFSGAIYARARAEGPSFFPVVKELLVRTGWQDTEALAAEVLGVDLADPGFWRTAVAPLEGLVDEFTAGR